MRTRPATARFSRKRPAGRQQAAAAAEVAQRNADAIAHAQQQLLEELDLWEAKSPSPGPIAAPPVASKPEAPRVAAPKKQPKAPAPAPTQLEIQAETTSPTTVTSAGLTVRLYEDLGPTGPAPVQTNRSSAALADPDEHLTLDEEIAFRQAPVFEEPATPTVPIPANLLEFPRQLVATRKARPMLALGPLLDTAAPPSGQLRIFEVEPEQISTEPTPPSAEPEWTSIWLDTPSPATADAAYTDASYTMAEPELHPNLVPGPLPPQTAAFGRRTMAAAVDAVLVLTGFVVFATVFITLAGTLPMGLPLALAAVAAAVVLAVLYHVLFFTFSDHTPGMSYARIALCTFDDENPTRKERQRRLWATLLAICPLGLGFAWAVLDEDNLGWHDRLSRTYQREY
ncbi:hypothetical protein FTO74_00705 [Granulicella sp. WH15]|uniref:RDD family protein n=1 Tax=Granulicella sp. WH15 TaxID=2602070 RepID=UPI001366FC45|nr:RDD family protein [Granulicella sp. WH15]QHN02063.1 hypothetical protein FTO74_00705 [Granulicella sp. WH15]